MSIMFYLVVHLQQWLFLKDIQAIFAFHTVFTWSPHYHMLVLQDFDQSIYI